MWQLKSHASMRQKRVNAGTYLTAAAGIVSVDTRIHQAHTPASVQRAALVDLHPSLLQQNAFRHEYFLPIRLEDDTDAITP